VVHVGVLVSITVIGTAAASRTIEARLVKG
jgi:hypothetical protein